MARRQRGEGTVYQRAEDGLWIGRIDLGYEGPPGHRTRRRKQVTARTQAACIKKLREARKAVDAGDRTTASMTLEAWLTVWLDKVCPGKPRMKPKTLATYRSYVNAYLIPAVGRVRLDRLTVQHVRDLHHFVLVQGLTSTTAGHAHRILGTALNDAMTDGKVQRNVTTLLKAPANTDGKRVALAMPQVVNFFRAIESDRLASRWHMAFFTGQRQGECLGLRWDQLDLDAGVVDVAWQLQRIPYKHQCGERQPDRTWPCGRRGADRCPARELDVQPGFRYEQLDGNLCLQRPKTHGSTRVIPLIPYLITSLRERQEVYLAERASYTVDHGLVWTRPDGRPIDGGDDRVEWHEHLEAAGVPAVDQHAARHTTSTLLLALGVTEDVRMSILGHSEAATNRLYSHVDLGIQRAAMEKLGDAFTKALAS